MSFPRGRFASGGSLAVLLICASAVPAQAQTTLRYKLKQGEKLDYQMEQKMLMKMNVAGKEVTMDLTQRIDLSWNIVRVDSNGSAKMKQKMNRIRMTMDGPTGKIEYDSREKKEADNAVLQAIAPLFNAMAGAEIEMTM